MVFITSPGLTHQPNQIKQMQPFSRGFKTPLRKKLSNSISAVSTLPGLPPRGIPKILGMERTLRGWIKSTNINCYLRLQVECRQTWTCNMCERLHEIKDGKLGRPPIIKDFSKVFLLLLLMQILMQMVLVK